MRAADIAYAIVERTGGKKTYVTFDIDCLDPAYAPGTGTPVAGGPSSAKILSVLRQLNQIDIVGADVVEVAPAYDHADITAIAGATVAMHYLGLLAERKARLENMNHNGAARSESRKRHIGLNSQGFSTDMKPKIFIDGEHGTTGLQIRTRLAGRDDIEVISIPVERRKDAAARADFLRKADVAILCLPDDAAKEERGADRRRRYTRDRRLDGASRRQGLDLRLSGNGPRTGEEDRRREAGRQSRLLAAGADRDAAPARHGRHHPGRLSDHHERHLRLFRRRPPDGRGL